MNETITALVIALWILAIINMFLLGKQIYRLGQITGWVEAEEKCANLGSDDSPDDPGPGNSDRR